MRCQNCKNWEVDEFYKSFGVCNCNKFKDVSENWDSDNWTDDMVVYFDHESYQAELMTGKNFGCIHFEKKVNE
jgi:hypothetical protein